MVNNLGFPKFESFYILGNIPRAIQVNAGFPFYVYLENSRQFRTGCGVDNQRVTKSYENPVAFFVFVILLPFSANTDLCPPDIKQEVMDYVNSCLYEFFHKNTDTISVLF